MASAKSVSKTNQHSNYFGNNQYKKNREAKLMRHLKKYPNDEQAQQALKDVTDTPRRSTPKTRVWSSVAREVAQMLARVGINGNHALGGKASEKIGDGEDKRFYGDESYDKSQKKRRKSETNQAA